jgi:hypothetical protein
VQNGDERLRGRNPAAEASRARSERTRKNRDSGAREKSGREVSTEGPATRTARWLWLAEAILKPREGDEARVWA